MAKIIGHHGASSGRTVQPVPSMHNARLAITALGIECSFDTFHNKLLFGFKDDTCAACGRAYRR